MLLVALRSLFSLSTGSGSGFLERDKCYLAGPPFP